MNDQRAPYSTRRGRNGAWQRFERGEMTLFPFYEAFGRELSDTANGNVWYAEYWKLRFPDKGEYKILSIR